MLRIAIASVLLISSLSSQEVDLRRHECSFYSKSGIDGVLAKIFQEVQPSCLYCVEIGSGNGQFESNTLLLRLQGWGCVLFDKMHENHKDRLFKEFITAENVGNLLAKYGVPEDFALLCLDTGYNDYYLWKAIDRAYRPSVVMIRFNPHHLPSEDKIVQYHPFFAGDHTTYYGASILALQKLGRSKGYSLVYAERSGTYLFFVREDLLLERDLNFKNADDVEQIYKAVIGEPPVASEDPKLREYVSSEFRQNS